MGITSETASISTQRRLFLSRGLPYYGGMMKSIELTQGQVALVDDTDFEKLNKHKWCAVWRGWGWYAMRSEHNGGNRRGILMHREIMAAQPGQMIDHRNRRGLDNRRENLRFCTTSQNNANAKKRVGSTSKYKGVSLFRRDSKWQVHIRLHGKNTYLGRFDSEVEAALIYNVAAIEWFGEFARLNVIEENGNG